MMFNSRSELNEKLRNSQKALRDLEAQVRSELAPATTLQNQDAIESDWSNELWEAELDIAYFKTQILREECWAKDVPFPRISEAELKDDGGEHWQRSRRDYTWSLTKKGIHDVRASLHAENTRRFEATSRWVLLVFAGLGAFTGFFGVLVGLQATREERTMIYFPSATLAFPVSPLVQHAFPIIEPRSEGN